MKEATIAIIDNRPLILQTLVEQVSTVADMVIVAIGRSGDHILPIVDTWQPDILILSTDLPQTENNEVVRLQIIPILRTLNRHYTDTKIIFLASKHLPVLAYLAVEHLGIMGYILMQDPRIMRMVEVIRHVLVGRKICSKSVQEERFALAIQKQGLSDTQIFILSAVATDPNLTQQQLADIVGITHGTLRNVMSQLFQACGVRNLTAAMMATNAWDIRQFQLNQ